MSRQRQLIDNMNQIDLKLITGSISFQKNNEDFQENSRNFRFILLLIFLVTSPIFKRLAEPSISFDYALNSFCNHFFVTK